MSDAKKPGGRDISDLKARLGLKKGDAGAPRTAAMPAQGVPPPNAAKIGGFVPPPPGVAPPPGSIPPPVAPMPDASTDPFGAMNAMAATAAQRAPAQPEFIVVNDGKPVEQVAGGGAVRFVKYGALVVVSLFVGYVLAGILAKHNANNETNAKAKLLYEDFATVGKGLTDLQNVLDGAKDRGKGQFAYPDPQLVTDIEALKLQMPDKSVIFHVALRNLDVGDVEAIFKFYTDLATLYAKVDEFKRGAKGSERKNTPKPQGNYAVVLRAGSTEAGKESPPTAELVELGAPICKGDTKVNPNGCGNDPANYEKFQVRTDPGGGFMSILPIATKDVAADNILSILPNGELKAFSIGADPFVDEVLYRRRIMEIDTAVREMSESRAALQNKLNALTQ